MTGPLSEIRSLERHEVAFGFVLVGGLLAPGAAVLWSFQPELMYSASFLKVVFLSFVLATMPALLNFLVLSVAAYKRGRQRSGANLVTEFTFALICLTLSYGSLVLLRLLGAQWSTEIFVVIAAVVDIMAMAVALVTMPSEGEDDS